MEFKNIEIKNNKFEENNLTSKQIKRIINKFKLNLNIL